LGEATPKPGGWLEGGRGAAHRGGPSDPLPVPQEDLRILVKLFRAQGVGARSTPLAVHLLRKTGSLGGVVACSPHRLRQLGVLESELEALALVGDALTLTLKRRIEDRPVLASYSAVLDYLHASMAYLPHEALRVLFLNARSVLIHDEVMFRGSVTTSMVFPREIVARALEVGATALIMVHNHPSGEPEPSKDDVVITRRVRAACREVDVLVFDHLIVGRNGHCSLRARDLM
jgi:DNA repair protein RadC